ncbi:hypothetical protein KSF_065660 [Reticulibacter mediterranei]|uniref:Asl1-like glycosyl hydrolase catalytic domain-containing protein n=1 Tax=Reticulibacter mediterranei TaxID=2778369 RepID=A0A8J3N5I1_9CHLR|nr:glycosyl hydrolase [Reticulibacter mediterranei]GHO96518.1 hypothetical protein KSF_065660 [Reticulibacter mediterranei]
MTTFDLSGDSSQGEHSLRAAPIPASIPKWKQSLITIIPAWLVSSILAPVMNACFPQCPFLVMNLIETIILVVVLTYLILPATTKILHRWLVTSHNTSTRRRKRRSQRRAIIAPRLQVLLLLLLTVIPTFLVAQTQPSALAAPTLSPYVWGTNLSLYNGEDFFLTNQATVKLTQQIHVQLIRFPYRGNLAVTEAAARQIAAIHATPLLILPYGVEQLNTDQQLIQMMNGIFGTQQPVYYEYGNERDLPANGGINAATYTTSWNTMIAHVKPLAPTGRFIGPVTSHADPAYLGTFLKQANPRPDAVSWHEYTCGTKDPDTICIQGITKWGTHIQEARDIMQQTIGISLPIMITEYNWNPNAQNDPRATNSTFLGTWMSAAIAELLKGNVFAANQYVLTNNAQLAMIADSTHTLTAIGDVFQSTFEQAQSQMQLPPSSVTPLATSTPKTPTPRGTETSGSTTLLCFQEQAPTEANTQPRVLCIPLVNGSGKAISGQPIGSLCFPLYPAPGQQTAISISTVCAPVYEATAPITTSTSSLTPTVPTTPTAGTTGSPTPQPTNSPPPTATVSNTPSVTPLLTTSPTPTAS